MSEDEQEAVKAQEAANKKTQEDQAARDAQQAFWRQQERLREQQQAEAERQRETAIKLNRVREQAQYIQEQIDSRVNTHKVAIIVAVDNQRGFAKDHKIPWHYKGNFKWFKNRTQDQICVMGRHTYEEINEKMGEKGVESVLPNRKCVVVSTTLTELQNATVVPNVRAALNLLDDSDSGKTVYIIGGERLFVEALAMVDTVVLTVINKDYECDQFFNVEYLMKHFRIVQTFKTEDEPDLRFLVLSRNT